MKYDLEPAKQILRTFLSDIDKVKAIRKQISPPQAATSFTIKEKMPEFDATKFDPAEDSFWSTEDAYIWLYADAWRFRSLMHRPPPKPILEYYYQPALPIYQQWKQQKKEVFYRQCEMIPEPSQELTLWKYLEHLAFLIDKCNEDRDVWMESLCCFLQFIREDTNLDQRGPLENLFPSQQSCKGMEIRKVYEMRCEEGVIENVERNCILRRIEETVSPIDIYVASEILMNLAKAFLEGRKHSQRSAAEALGFAWLCHAVGCYRLVTRKELVFVTKLNNFSPLDLNQPKELFKPTHFIGVSSLYGIIDVPVSKILYDFLMALPRHRESTHIFSMALDSIERTLRKKGIEPSKRARGLGKITFLTYMSQPTHATGHRPKVVLNH